MTNDAPLSNEDKIRALKMAAESMEGAKTRWADRVRTGLSDEQLAEALQYELGTIGGYTRENIGVTYQGSGLKVWADRCIGSRKNPPIMGGQATVRAARELYGISDPNDKQGRLF